MGTEIIDPGASLVDYSQHFWGERHNGYQVMYDNLKRGEDAVSEVAQFIKERLSAEEEYAKLLGKGTNKISSFLSNGTCLENGWSLTKATFEIIQDVQTMMVKNLQDLSREILKYKEEVAKVRKDAKQQEVIEAVNLMQTTTTCLQKAKETYQSRWVEHEKLRKDTSSNPKEISKAETKLVKAREEYKSYVEKYEVVRVVYEEKMEAMCKFFQNHDRSHFANLQQFLMVYASHHQEVASSTQQLCGQLRESLQQQSVDDQLAHFIKEKGTGMERPQAAVFEDIEAMAAAENETLPGRMSERGGNTGGGLQTSMSHPPTSAGNDLLGLDILDAWTAPDRKASAPVQPSPTASHSSDSTSTAVNPSVFGSSMGAGTKKLSMFMPKRKKTISQSSIGDEESTGGGGLFKFRQNRRSKKSTNDLSAPHSIQSERPFDGHSMDDARSTASSSRSEEKEKQINGSLHILDQPNGRTDEEGYSIPTHHEMEKEDTNWSSCSSDEEEDEIEMQQSRIRSISIKPAESAAAINASVDELRDAIGHINIGSLGRSSTFDKDPWSVAGSKPPLFSQSMTAGSLKPLRPVHTADGRFRSNFAESEFSKSNVPINFSASCGPMAGMARARPRSNTPTHNSTFGLSVGNSSHNTSGTLTKDGTNTSQEWGSSSFGINRSDSHNSLGGSSFNLSQSTANLMQATISEQRVPLAMAINEYSHVWFNGPDVANRTIRTFGAVMISFASSSLPLLTDVNSEIEKLSFQLNNTDLVKTVVPNKQLLLPPSTAEGVTTSFTFDRLGLANWLLSQQKERSSAAFFNVEVLRYELKEEGPTKEPPLLIKSYWKCEEDHTDLRIDYHLNTEGPVSNALLNLVFSAKVSGEVNDIISDPNANWSAETSTISWMVTELSKHGDSSGSLKARIRLTGAGPSQPAHTHAQFQSSDTTISGVSVALTSTDTYHLSMVKKKVQAGKYFCEPEIRK